MTVQYLLPPLGPDKIPRITPGAFGMKCIDIQNLEHFIQYIKVSQEFETNSHRNQARNKRQPDEVTDADVLIARFDEVD